MEVNTNFGSSGDGDYTVTQEPAEITQDSDVESLASPFLERVPSQDRAIVGRYIKEWDSGAQKKFREYQGRIKPYESLGSIEDLTKYRNFVNNFQTNPEGFFRLMWQGLEQQYGDQFETELMRILAIEAQQEAEEEMSDPQYYEQNGDQQQYDPNEAFQLGTTERINQIEEWMQSQEQARQESAQQEQLTQLLGQMHQHYGDFDDTWVLTRLADGRTMDQALGDWKQMVAKYSQPAPRQAPVVMGGQGGVPTNQVNTQSLRGKDRRAAVAAMLAGLGEQG